MGRGLSLVQRDILETASKGYVTPREAWNAAFLGNSEQAYAVSSRALSRLCKRNLLEKVETSWGFRRRGRWHNFDTVYRLVGFIGPLPLVRKKTSFDLFMEESNQDSSVSDLLLRLQASALAGIG